MEKNNIIGIVMATKLEAKPFINGLSMEQLKEESPLMFKEGNLFLIISGIGKVNAAIATSYLIQQYNPHVIFNFGAAGACKEGFNVGDIFHISSAREMDKLSFKTGKPVKHSPDTLKGHNELSLATRDKPAITSEDRISVGKYGDLIDMEGSAVIQTCRFFKLKCYLFKIITDTMDHTSHIQIVTNVRNTREKLYTYIIENKVLSAAAL